MTNPVVFMAGPMRHACPVQVVFGLVLVFCYASVGYSEDPTHARAKTLAWYRNGGAALFYESSSTASGWEQSIVTGVEFTEPLIAKYGAAAFQELAKLDGMQELTFRSETLNDDSLQLIAAMPSLQNDLKRLRIGWHGDERRGRVSSVGLQAIVALKHLQELRIDGPQLDDRALDAITKLEKLETLQLTNTTITDAGIAKLNALKNLKSLILQSNDVRGETFHRLTNLDSLLIVCQPGDKWSFRFSQDRPGIRELWLTGDVTTFTFKSYAESGGTPALRLSAAQFTDADLLLVQDAAQLRHLRLDGSAVKGTTLRTLCRKRKLDVLDCRRCGNVRPLDIEAIKSENRSMMLVH